MLAGLVGMKIATNSNARTAQAASEPEQGPAGGFFLRRGHGLHRGGPGSAGRVHLVCDPPSGAGIDDPVTLGNIMVMNGMGASFMALFARVGGGIHQGRRRGRRVGKVEAHSRG